MVTQVKICGVRTLRGAAAVKTAGADLAGLNFVSTSRRRLQLDIARQLAAALRPVKLAGVFADFPIEELRYIARALALDYVQLHGDESPELCSVLAKDHRVIKAMSVTDALTAEQLAAYAPFVTLFLFDGPNPGSGAAFDWQHLIRLAPT